jgi:uncharacterized protein (DUF3820 family)
MQVTDNTPMSFGQHKGKPMANVPAVYLLYIFNKGWVHDPGVKQYILNNLDALKAEAAKVGRR